VGRRIKRTNGGVMKRKKNRIIVGFAFNILYDDCTYSIIIKYIPSAGEPVVTDVIICISYMHIYVYIGTTDKYILLLHIIL